MPIASARGVKEPPAVLEYQNPWNLRPREWWNLALRVKRQLEEDNVAMVAAGLAFYEMLAIFPILVAFVAAYGLISDPADVETLAKQLSDVMPASGREVFSAQLHALVEAPSAGLGIGLVVSLATLIWSASAGLLALIKAINIAYDQDETRAWWKLRGTALMFTGAALPAGIVALVLVAVMPSVLSLVGMDEHFETILNVSRWPILAIAVFAFLTVLYRMAPDRKPPPVRWLTPGALLATLLWLGVSAGFSLYVQHFGNYAKTYGTLGGVVVLLFWFYLSSFVILLGAELDAEMERYVAGYSRAPKGTDPKKKSEPKKSEPKKPAAPRNTATPRPQEA
jgi:membrane protein